VFERPGSSAFERPAISTVPAATDLLRDLRDAVDGITKANDALYQLTIDLHGGVDAETGEMTAGLANEYEAAIDREIIAIEESALADGRRIPAADLRAARARLQVRESRPELFRAYVEKTARVEALSKWIAAKKTVVSGLQSVLRGERE
jgi:hypothetical protein